MQSGNVTLNDILLKFNVPIALNLQQLAEHYGIKRSRFYNWDIIEIFDADIFVKGQIDPVNINFHVDYDLLPADYYGCLISNHEDPSTNHKITLTHLDKILGQPLSVNYANAISHCWKYEDGEIVLTTCLEHDPSAYNPAHLAHPELKTFCHLYFKCDFNPPPSAIEVDWMKNIRCFSQQGDAFISGRGKRGINRHLKDAKIPDMIGYNPNSNVLIGIYKPFAWFISRETMLAVRLSMLKAARGADSATIDIVYNNIFSSQRGAKTQNVFASPKLDGLKNLAVEIASWAGVPLEIYEGYND